MPLAIFCGCTARFVAGLVGNPEDSFSHNEAHMVKLQKQNKNYLVIVSYNHMIGWFLVVKYFAVSYTVAICDIVHNVETVFIFVNCKIASGNLLGNMSDALKATITAICSFPGVYFQASLIFQKRFSEHMIMGSCSHHIVH